MLKGCACCALEVWKGESSCLSVGLGMAIRGGFLEEMAF